MTDSDEDRDEFVQIYLEESGEEIEQLIKLLLLLEQEPEDVETLREAFRLLHTFKGSSGMMGYDRINALAHELESRFDACRSGRERMTSEAVSVVLRCVDFFREYLDRLAAGNEDQGDPTPLIAELASIVALPFAESDKAPAEPPASEPTPAAPPAPEVTPAEPPAPEATEEAPASSQEVPAAPVPDQTRSRPAADSGPVVSKTKTLESGPVRELTIGVRFTDGIELPDLKARLIVARLQALGDILSIKPTIDTIDQAEHPITLRVQLRSAREHHVFTESLDIEGVASVFVADPEELADAKAGAVAKEAASATAKADVKAPSKAVKEADGSGQQAKAATAKRSGETIRVGIDRLDRLMNLAGELVVTNARFDQLADEMRLLFRSGGSIEAGSPLAETLLRAMARYGGVNGIDDVQDVIASNRIRGIVGDDGGSEEGAAMRRGWMERGRRVAGQVSETVDQLARLSRSIQQAVLETRMIPIGPMFNRFRRTVRDIAMKQNKQVLLELDGEMTELDKRMVDELGDPMIHLIRNAVDHGIESGDERKRCGKRAEGMIRLRAYHQSNHVVIEIEDDGAGIDAARVRARALERGLATESELRMMPDTEVYGFIWHAGFSTAEQVSEISGRGVGMDVVRDRISALGGVVELSSKAGVGSTVSIRLPLTLSIVNAMIVRFRGFRLAIPVTDVFEIYGLSRSEIFESQGREMIDVRGRLLPLYRLDELFHWNDYLPNDCRNRNALVQAVLVRHGLRSLAIEVDDLDGNSDIVIKSLDEHFSHIPGLGGACVMGDGEVCLVLDTAGLSLKTSNHHAKPEDTHA